MIPRHSAVRPAWGAALAVLGLSLALGGSAGEGPPAATGPVPPRAIARPAATSARPATASAPSSTPAAEYKAKAGPHHVATAEATWRDAARKRDVPIRLYAPLADSAPGRLPAVVISHGLGGSRRGYAYIARHLAGHGYVCVVPTHVGADTEILLGGAADGMRRAVTDPNNRILRPQDVSFVIDRLTAADQDQPLVKGRVDGDRIGVAGHSFGAYTALAVAGQTTDLPGQDARSFRDARVKASLAMSPQAPGVFGLTRRSWTDIHIPVMLMTGTLDMGMAGMTPAQRRFAFDHMPPGDKYFLLIEGARHMAFSDNLVSPAGLLTPIQRDSRHHAWILQCATAFFDAYLGGQVGAKTWLQERRIAAVSAGQAALDIR